MSYSIRMQMERQPPACWPSTGEDEIQPDFTGANFQGATLWNKSGGLHVKALI